MNSKPKVETFIENIFGVNCDAANRHFVNSNDRTTWYRVTRHGTLGAPMHVPGMNDSTAARNLSSSD